MPLQGAVARMAIALTQNKTCSQTSFPKSPCILSKSARLRTGPPDTGNACLTGLMLHTINESTDAGCKTFPGQECKFHEEGRKAEAYLHNVYDFACRDLQSINQSINPHGRQCPRKVTSLPQIALRVTHTRDNTVAQSMSSRSANHTHDHDPYSFLCSLRSQCLKHVLNSLSPSCQINFACPFRSSESCETSEECTSAAQTLYVIHFTVATPAGQVDMEMHSKEFPTRFSHKQRASTVIMHNPFCR